MPSIYSRAALCLPVPGLSVCMINDEYAAVAPAEITMAANARLYLACVGGGGTASEVYDNGGAVVRGSGGIWITPVAAASAGVSIWSMGAITI